jgi:hypothetical protein
MWYQHVAGPGQDELRADKADLRLATASSCPALTSLETAISSVAFSVIQNNPNQDPVISNCYMSDYNNIVSIGTTSFITWGDNPIAVATSNGTESQPDVFRQSD